MESKFKLICSTIVGGLATFCKQYGLMIILVIVAIAFDVITGLIKAKVTGEGLNSNKGTKGFFKKMALLVTLFFAFFMDYAIPIFLGSVNIGIDYNMPFGLIVAFYIVLNEAISICENLFAINPDAMPLWIVKFLMASKEKIDNEDINKNEDTSEE